MKSSTPAGLYVHIPFCLTKCPYCDFFSITELALLDDFLEALSREASLYSGQFQPFDSLYIGGGTPSVLSTVHMARLFSYLWACFTFDPSCEITVEVNPDDVTAEKLHVLSAEGVNRLSIGVQSFHDRDLSFLKRRHSAAAGRKAIESALDAGFENLSIDLIYALPGQTKRSWLECIEQAVTYPISHLSCYQLTVEEETPFGRMRQEGDLKMAGERKERDLFLLTSQFLEANGFIHYEVSNYARGPRAASSFSPPPFPFHEGEAPAALPVEGAPQAPVMVSRHNTKYWTHAPYLGLGPSAHSFDGATRWWNCKSIQEYCELLKDGRYPTAGHEELTADQLRLERLYLGFRTMNGVSRGDLDSTDHADQTVSRLVRSGLVEISGERITPTRRGYLIADRLPLLF